MRWRKRQQVIVTVGCSLALPMAVYQMHLGLKYQYLPPVVVGSVILFVLGLLAGLLWREPIFMPVVKTTTWLWGMGISLLALVWSYERNQGWCFFGGLLLLLWLLWRLRSRLRAHRIWLQVVNTLVLGLVLLPLADRVLAPVPVSQEELLQQKAYSYAVSGRNPVLFGQWWHYFCEQWTLASRAITRRDPAHKLPFRFIPGSQTKFFNAEFTINPLGFRDEPFALSKNGAYRIVALGESTTMGVTLERDEQPWPKMLENQLQARFGTNRPIQVINAGVAAFNLKHNLARFEADILPLEPDMIISYHGYNGFCFLDQSLPPPLGESPPIFRARPLYLLAQAEYRVKMIRFLRNHLPEAPPATEPSDLNSHYLKNAYADLYRQLIRLCQEHEIQLVLGTFSMAVNSHSPPDVVSFYQQGFPSVDRLILVNQVHTRMLKELAQQDAEVLLVHTEEGLDGCYDQYIDLVHFTESGRARLTQHFLQAIEPLLSRQLPPADASGMNSE